MKAKDSEGGRMKVWAIVSKKSGKIVRSGFDGDHVIYFTREEAEDDMSCFDFGHTCEVRRAEIVVLPDKEKS